MEDETMELQQIQQDLLHEQEKLGQRKEAMRAEQHHLQLENQARVAAKEAARAQASEEDRRLMQETLQTLDAKEQQRLADLEAFHVCSSVCCILRQREWIWIWGAGIWIQQC